MWMMDNGGFSKFDGEAGECGCFCVWGVGEGDGFGGTFICGGDGFFGRGGGVLRCWRLRE